MVSNKYDTSSQAKSGFFNAFLVKYGQTGGIGMDWISGLQKAINYIEDHLTDEIDYESVAAESFSSSYHFQRVFSILCGYTLGEYIRLRRLSLAGAELAHGRGKVIDVALKYGYDSPDSFAKAFQKFHGITPSQARGGGAALRSFSRLVIKISLEGGSVMNYRIEEKEKLVLTGYKKRFCGIPGQRQEQEEALYLSTRPLQKVLWDLSKNREKDYNVIANVDDDGYDFYIATELEKTQVEGLEKDDAVFEMITIPACTYAIFETERCTHPTMTFLELRRKIASEWLPNSGYQLADTPELVVTHWFMDERRKR